MDLPDLPHEVEIRPLTALREITPWADYVALDMPRESLPGLRQMLGLGEQARVQLEAQVLIVTPIPCGGIAECGVCAVTIRHGWKLACKDGPVFDLQALI
jgi:NAD(P)H-flavin reductase